MTQDIDDFASNGNTSSKVEAAYSLCADKKALAAIYTDPEALAALLKRTAPERAEKLRAEEAYFRMRAEEDRIAGIAINIKVKAAFQERERKIKEQQALTEKRSRELVQCRENADREAAEKKGQPVRAVAKAASVPLMQFGVP